MNDFVNVTELSGDSVSEEQVERMVHRYQWASRFCVDKDVLEVGCGTGQGLGLFLKISKNIEAGDYSKALLSVPMKYYGNKLNLRHFDAQDMPHEDGSKDVIVLFEAIYYLPDASKFVAECKRILRPNGIVLIATANKELEDFNPSPHSFKYYNCAELQELFSGFGFQSQFFGYMEGQKDHLKSKIIRFLKKVAVSYGLMPKTMAGKKFLKRFVFGKLVAMPYEIVGDEYDYVAPTKIEEKHYESRFKVIYCAAEMT